MYDTLEDFYLAEALEYIHAWRQATADRPAGICGPIGPTEQLPLVARLVNELGINLRHAHFWGMDEWVIDGREAPESFPLSFARTDRELCFNRIRPELRDARSQPALPQSQHDRRILALVRPGPLRRRCKAARARSSTGHSTTRRSAKGNTATSRRRRPSTASCATRVVDLHPMTIIQNARTSGGGVVTNVPPQAISVGPVETWKAEKVSIWQAGPHDNPFGMRLTALMIGKRVARQLGADVAVGRSPERAIQLLPPRPRHLRSRNALTQFFPVLSPYHLRFPLSPSVFIPLSLRFPLSPSAFIPLSLSYPHYPPPHPPISFSGMPSAFAIAAHPDDIEFVMAGTMMHLKQAGYELHYMTIGNGSCGSAELDAATIARIRRDESRAAAAYLGATFHESLCPDIDIFYDRPTLARLGSIVREVAPEIILTHSPQDYMEDHTNTCRLAVTAAFCRGMPNFPVDPPRPVTDQDVTIYHAQPHGNCDALRNPIVPDLFVDVTQVIDRKTEMLTRHQSQKRWLDLSQGMDSYLRRDARPLARSRPHVGPLRVRRRLAAAPAPRSVASRRRPARRRAPPARRHR